MQVPVSRVYKKDLERDGQAPMLLYGYGAYGISMEPSFRSDRLSLIDRGVVYADRPHPRRSRSRQALA